MVESAARAAVRELKDADYSWIENMVRRCTNSDGDLDKSLFEPTAKGCRDYSQYGLMLKALFKRMFHRKYPIHIYKALELMKYLISDESPLSVTMRQQLKEDTKSAHLNDLESLTTFSDSKWCMTIRASASFIIDIISRTEMTPAASVAPGTGAGATLPRSQSYSSTPDPSPTSLASVSSSGSSTTLSTGYDPKIRAKLDGVYILDCCKVANGFGDLEVVQAIDFYMDTMKTVPVWHTITSERVWKSSKEVLKNNSVIQTVPTAKGGRVSESNFNLLLNVA